MHYILFTAYHGIYTASRSRADGESGERKLAGTATLLAATNDQLLREAGMEQVRKALRALTLVQAYAASDVHVAQRFLKVLLEKAFSLLFSNEITFF